MRTRLTTAVPQLVYDNDADASNSADGMAHGTLLDMRSAAVSGFACDAHDEFVAVIQRAGVHVLRMADITSGQGSNSGDDASRACASPLVSLRASAVRRRAGGGGRGGALGFGYTATQFLGDTVTVATSYARWPCVDVVDLEQVDEQTCACTRSFDLRRLQGLCDDTHVYVGDDAHDSTAPCARDLAAVSETTVLAALDNGATAWLDVRVALPCACTAPARGSSAAADCYASTAPAPLTSIALARAYSGSAMQLLCGTQRGQVQLWDVRHTRRAIAVHEAGSELGRVRVTYSGDARFGSALVWYTTLTGTLAALALGGSELSLYTSAALGSARRTEASVHLPAPSHSVCSVHDLLLYGDVAGNQLMLFDLAALHRSASLSRQPTMSAVRARCETGTHAHHASAGAATMAAATSSTAVLHPHEHAMRAALLCCMDGSGARRTTDSSSSSPPLATRQLSCSALVDDGRCMLVGYNNGDVAALRTVVA